MVDTSPATASTAPDWRPRASLELLQARARVNRLIRGFFAARAVLEVETPLLSRFGTTDRHIESFAVEGFVGGRGWLRTSPEFALKRLLAAGVGDCYELGKVFRRGEAGRRHNPEFSMLEWYRLGWDHDRLIDEVGDLIAAVAAEFGRTLRHRRIGYAALFQESLGIDPHRADDDVLLEALPDSVHQPRELERDDWLDLLFSLRIQPTLEPDCLVAVVDYPASQCALARLAEVDGMTVAQRFEVYLGPIELANGYHELVDAEEQTRRFAADERWRHDHGRPGPNADQFLLAAMRAGLPACAGVALGVDRLLQCLLGVEDLRTLLAFDAQIA